MGRLVLFVVAALCLSLAGSEDLYWRPNTDWINPANWKLGRSPCEGDVADFSSVPRGSVVRLDGDTVIRSVILPVGSTIELGRSLTLQFSNSTSCEIQTASGPMVAPVEENNLFVGAGPRYWESSENWETSDGKPAKSPPCGKDRAFFRDGHYYWSVESNLSAVSVQHLKVRGELVTTEFIPRVAPEFKLNLVVDSRCGENPALCPCFSDSLPSPSPSREGGGKISPSLPLSPTPRGRKTDGKNSGRTAAIVVVMLVLLLVLVGLTVLLILLWLRWRRNKFYKKDEFLGQPEDSVHSSTALAVSAGDGVLFDNPIYEVGGEGGGTGGKKAVKGSPDKDATRAHEMETIAILRPSVGHYEPVDYEEATSSASEPDKKTPVLAFDDYEQL